MNINTKKAIKSFTLRRRQITKAQILALQTLWPQYGIDCCPGKMIDPTESFSTNAPVVLEIGFGDGQSLLQTAKQYPKINFLGIEVYQSGIARLLHGIHADLVPNIRVIRGDAVDVLRDYILDSSISTIQLFFPDPWQKRRHHKRRIIKSDFIELIAKKLLVKGIFHFVTDWEDYAEYALTVMNSNLDFIRLDNIVGYIPTLIRSTTKFELVGQQLGHNIYEFVFQRRL